MPASTRWSVQIQPGRPPAVLLGGGILAMAAAVCVGASVGMQGAEGGVDLAAAAAILALVSWRLSARRRGNQRAAVLNIAPYLAADAAGNWSLREGGGWRAVLPLQVWRGPCWMTLALSPVEGPGRAAILTVWRGAVSAPDWRKLCVLLRARPGKAARGKRAEAP